MSPKGEQGDGTCLPSEATAAQRGTPGCRFHPARPTTAQPGAPLRAACFPAKSRTDAERRRSPRPQPGPRYPILQRKPDKTWERPCALRYHTPKATRASVLSAGLWATLAGSVSCAWIVEHSRDQASGPSVDVIARTSSLWTAALAVSLRSPTAALPELRPGPHTPRASPAACPSENHNDEPPPPHGEAFLLRSFCRGAGKQRPPGQFRLGAAARPGCCADPLLLLTTHGFQRSGFLRPPCQRAPWPWACDMPGHLRGHQGMGGRVGRDGVGITTTLGELGP